jgi:23S rRNA (cytosine1962-C5)-methyltransferase
MRKALLSCAVLASDAAALGTVTVSGPKAKLFKNGGHPLIFSGAIKQIQNAQCGEAVDVVDGAGELIGWGVFNPHSQYRVRMLAPANEPALLDHRSIEEVVRTRLVAAAQRREACCLPSTQTTAYRLINSEGDGISGLTVDVFGSTAVAISSALWLELRAPAVQAALRELPGIDHVVWRRSDGRRIHPQRPQLRRGRRHADLRVLRVDILPHAPTERAAPWWD